EPEPDLVVTTGFEIEGGETGLTELLGRVEWEVGRLPTAIVAVSDEVAMGVIYAAKQFGIRVPEDLSVVGVDDQDVAGLFDLTTVSQPVIEQGRIAGRVLMELVEHGTRPDPEVLRLPPGLVVRNTTTPPHGPG